MVFKALLKVFRHPRYILLAIYMSAFVFLFSVWLPNIRLITGVLFLFEIPATQKIALLTSLASSINTNFTTISAGYTVLISVLFGVNFAMMLFFLRRRIKEVRNTGVAVGILGTISGVLGVGCAACGSLLLVNVLSLVGATSVLTSLPLRGGEFGILGVILLLISLVLISRHIQNPAVCRIT